ncbi:PAS domain S-box protein [bacterium]|nr:PAS domain S-box protein [bacterium]
MTGNDEEGRGGAASAPGNIDARLEIYESMVEHCAVAMFAIDRNHKVIHWNRACEELTGLKAEDILGTPHHWKPFYDFQRPTLSDLLIDGQEEAMQQHYQVYGSSVLMPYSLHAQGWYPRVGGRERYLIFDASPAFSHDGTLMAAIETLQDITELKRVEEERKKLNISLQEALDKIKTLSGLIPICAGCKKIRDDKGFWSQIEEYLEKHSDASFSHGLCPECFQQFFPDAAREKKE